MESNSSLDIKLEEDRRIYTHYLGLVPIFVLIVIIFVRVTFVLCKSYGFYFWIIFFILLMMAISLARLRQKTRTPAPRRMYAGSRARPSLSQAEPTIYVSPNNLPPPPKYECLAPPSYEEVVGIHYPQYQSQPIIQPITAAMASAQASAVNITDPPTVLTVTSETRTSVQVAAS